MEVSWDDVEHFCKHTRFLEPLCGRRDEWKEQFTVRGFQVKTFALRDVSYVKFPNLLMFVIDAMKGFPKERILTWSVVAMKFTHEYNIVIRVYFI